MPPVKVNSERSGPREAAVFVTVGPRPNPNASPLRGGPSLRRRSALRRALGERPTQPPGRPAVGPPSTWGLVSSSGIGALSSAGRSARAPVDPCAREVFERSYTIGGRGVTAPPPPPQTNGTIVGNNGIYKWGTSGRAIFGTHTFWVPDPPPPAQKTPQGGGGWHKASVSDGGGGAMGTAACGGRGFKGRARAGMYQLTAVGGGGYPPPPPGPGCYRGKNEVCKRQYEFGPFLVHTLLGPSAPPPRSKDALLTGGGGFGPQPPPDRNPPPPPLAHTHQKGGSMDRTPLRAPGMARRCPAAKISEEAKMALLESARGGLETTSAVGDAVESFDHF